MIEAKIPSGPIERQLVTGRSEITPLDLDARIPLGPIEQKWDKCRFDMKLVNPANRRKHSIIVVGAGLAGAAAAATLGQQGYHVHCFSYHDTPRRAHSIAAQGGINAAKNYRNDGDSISRLFKDTVKGGDFRAREANVYRLAQISLNIIDQCVAQGVPFAREYGGLLDTRSRAQRQRHAIVEAIAPIWEANHVWLILVIVLLFSAFPRAFSAMMIALHIPITAMLIGIVLRGSAFVFRKYDSTGEAEQPFLASARMYQTSARSLKTSQTALLYYPAAGW
jgi:hypothetical protein